MKVRHHEEDSILVFDDSKSHLAFNDSSSERVVLIVDILRPPHVPPGVAVGGHTQELDKFVSIFR
jgi:aspartyl/asparaginyl beta-hydroxylase (cupin superfamily)